MLILLKSMPGDKIRKWPYLLRELIMQKLGEKKVPLIFSFAASFPRNGYLLYLHIESLKCKNKGAYISQTFKV